MNNDLKVAKEFRRRYPKFVGDLSLLQISYYYSDTLNFARCRARLAADELISAFGRRYRSFIRHYFK